jgi:hypothetical protein
MMLAKLNVAVAIAGGISEMPYYNSGSLTGLKPYLIVNVLFLP